MSEKGSRGDLSKIQVRSRKPSVNPQKPRRRRQRKLFQRALAREMRAPRSSSLIAPSPALLQFLRFQAAEVPFFTPNAIRANPARRPPAWRPRGRDSPARTRAFGSSSCRAAACEASLLPSGFLPRSHDPRPPDSNQRHEAHSKDARPLSAWFALRGWHADEPTGHHDGRANGHRWGSGPTWWEDLKGRTKHKGGGGGQGGGFCGEDPEVDFWTDSSLLSRAKAPNELKLRCTELDENGKVTVIDGEFKKTELIARVRSPQTHSMNSSLEWDVEADSATPSSSACCRATSARSTRRCCPRSSCGRR